MALEIIRKMEAPLDVSDGERSVVSRINTACVDRYGTVICPEGVDRAAFLKAPAVLCNHGQSNDGLPVGRCLWIRYMKADRTLVAKTQFLEDSYSDGLFRMAQAGVMNGYSVRILPDVMSCSAPTSQELRKEPDLAACWMMIRKCELAEYSIVSVPGNPEALAMAVSRGLTLPDRLWADLGDATTTTRAADPAIDIPPSLPPFVGRSFGEVHSSFVRRLRTSLAPGDARKAAADAVDLLRGRI